MKDIKEYKILDAVTPQAVTSSTDATPIVVTKASHGYSTGDTVLIYGHTTNIAANGIFRITVLSSSTFSLQSTATGADVAGSGAGAGASGIVLLAPKIVLCSDTQNVGLTVGTTGTATTTLKVAGSNGKTDGSAPNFGGTVAPSNPYTFVQITDLDTGVPLNGATGIVVAGSDINKNYELNAEVVKYLTVFPISWSAGAITVTATIEI